MRQQGQKALSDIIVGREGLGFDLPFWLNITMSLTEGSPPHLKLPSDTPVGDTEHEILISSHPSAVGRTEDYLKRENQNSEWSWLFFF